MATNQEYWKKRQQQLWNQLETDEKKLTQKLSKKYDSEAKQLEKQIAYYYKSYGDDNIIQYRRLMEELPADDKRLLIEQMDDFMIKYPEYVNVMPVRETIYKLNRLEGMRESIYIQQMQIGAIEQKELVKHLEKQYERGYGTMAKELGYGTQFNKISPDVLKKTVGATWCNGKNFSSRIWDNRKKLAEYLNNDFSAAMARGDSYERCMSQLKGRFGKVSKKDMFGLIYTEGTYIMNEAIMTPFEEDFEEYKISIADNNACDICKALVNKKFKIKDRVPGTNFPPLHTRCRCTFTIIMGRNFVNHYVKKNGDPRRIDGIINKKEFIPAGSLSEAERFVINELGIENVSYKGVDLETANEWNRGLMESFERFPELKNNFGFVGEAHERNKAVKSAMYQYYLDIYRRQNPNTPESVLKPFIDKAVKNGMRGLSVGRDVLAQSWSPTHVVFRKYAGVTVNRDWGKDSALFKASLKRDVKSGYHPQGCDTIRSVLDHEIGHQIDTMLDVRNNPEFNELYLSMSRDDIGRELSGYALKSDGEFIAEAWAEYCNSDSPRPAAQKVGELIERRYEAWKEKSL